MAVGPRTRKYRDNPQAEATLTLHHLVLMKTSYWYEVNKHDLAAEMGLKWTDISTDESLIRACVASYFGIDEWDFVDMEGNSFEDPRIWIVVNREE